MSFKVGVIAIQGGFTEHVKQLEAISVDCCEVRLASEAELCDAFIIPGGESTVIWHLMTDDLKTMLRNKHEMHAAFWGTCAGAILLSKHYLNFIDITVTRNAYGKQINSHMVDVYNYNYNSKSFLCRSPLIRAPKFDKLGKVGIIAIDGDDNVLAVGNSRCFVSSFHPELIFSNEFNWHSWFVDKAQDINSSFVSLA